MGKFVKGFLKVARLIVVICLFILAAYKIVELINGLDGPFMVSVSNVLRTILLLLLYLVPAILLATKKDKQGFVVLSFLLGYLIISGTISFLGYAISINSDSPVIYLIQSIFGFILAVLFAISICCFLFDKGFGTKLMKLANPLLVVSLLVLFVFIVLDIIFTISEGTSFGDFFKALGNNLIVPCIVVFGLLLIGNE